MQGCLRSKAEEKRLTAELSMGWVDPRVRLGWVGSTVPKLVYFMRIILMDQKLVQLYHILRVTNA